MSKKHVKQFDEAKYHFMRYMKSREQHIPAYHVRPHITAELLASMKKAATTYQRRNETDRSAYGRAMMNMEQGIYTPHEITAGNLSL